MERRLFFYILLILLHFPFSPATADEDSTKMADLKREGIAYAMAGNFDSAIIKFQGMLAIDSSEIAAWNNLGRVSKMLGRYNDALKEYLKAADLAIKQYGDDYEDLSEIYTNIGNIYTNKQDYELALQYLNYTERIVEVNDPTTNIATTLYNNIGNVYFYMKDFRKALRSYLKGVDVKKKYRSSGLDISYANCASTYENLDLLDSARIYYVLAIQSKIDQYGEDSYQLINVYNIYSMLLLKLGESEEALDYLSKALHIAEGVYPAKHPVISECHRYLGGFYLKEGKPQESLEHNHKAVLAVVFDFDNPDPLSNPSLDSDILSEVRLLEALNGKASALFDLYQESGEVVTLNASLETLEASNLLAEKMRSSYMGQESKLFITETSHENLSKAINTAFDLYELTGNMLYAEKAFHFAEKSKSSVLLASLQEVENKKNLAIPSSLQNHEDELKNEREVYKKKVYDERQRENPDSEKLRIWQAKLLSLSRQLDSINNDIRVRFPEYASKYDNEVIDLEGVRKGLKAGQVLLEYVFTDSLLITFLIDKENAFLTRNPVSSDYLNEVDILSHFLRNNDFANNTTADYKAYISSAYTLYRILLQPVEDRITGTSLIIIPDGELGYIPFEALLTSVPPEGGMDYRSLPYLIYKYRTNYSYSATLLFSNQASAKTAEHGLLAFAPTYEHVGEIKGDKFPTYREYSTYLVPLKFISQEIENISNIMPSDRYVDYDATENAFREKAPGYDILHLAMHTLINDENPMYSQLVFTLNNDTIENNDGLLNTYEIFNIKLSARMVVLSACNTGYGQLRKGEGIMSLARGFIYAGVPSIIMTLWAVEDQSGSILMSKFYENLADGQEIDAALREAKLQYLKEADQLSAHPYLWSGYVSIGSTAPLVRSGQGIWYMLGIAIGVIMLSVAVFMVVRRRKRA